MPVKILSLDNILRALFFVALIVSLFLLEGQYAACLAVLFVWFLLADQKGYLFLGAAAVLLGFGIYLLLGPSFVSFVLSLLPIIFVSWLPERRTSDFWTQSAGPGLFGSPQEAQAERRRKTNRLFRWM